jgi:hypothetical protein
MERPNTWLNFREGFGVVTVPHQVSEEEIVSISKPFQLKTNHLKINKK